MHEQIAYSGMSAHELRGLVEDYLRVFPDEKARLAELIQFIDHGDPARLYDRSYALGHITASAFILSPCRKEVLLVHHLELDILLQPGGHIDPCDGSPLAGALREVREETGITGLRQLLINTHHLVPFDINTHHIPANEYKNEGSHVHHDFRYLFVSESTAVGSTPEASGRQWVDFNALSNVGSHKGIADKIRYALTKEVRATTFYDRVIDCLKVNGPVDTVVVAHLIPDVFPYLTALSQVSNIAAVIPKPRSQVSDVRERVKKDFCISDLNRELIAEQGLGPLISQSGGFVLLDIGGYFAPLIANGSHGRAPGFLGIVEDTENGHQKYAALECHSAPIFSVARSPLKETEDLLVGQSVVFSADAVLRDLGQLFQYSRVGILGFGKVGRSILHHVMQRNVVPMVYECNPIRRLEAFNLGARVPNRATFISKAEVIFSATGSRALTLEDFRKLKSGCFVFSVTSSDDEMDLSCLPPEYDIHVLSETVIQLYGRHNYFYLVNGGNAVNFIHKAVLGDFIHLVRAEMLFALEALSYRNVNAGIQEVSGDTRKRIAAMWLDTFVDS